ncbi:MAG: hypothetical protein E7Z99_03310 [Coriobacteriaceae bacterium]|nr:hypothetical protein [Coriobacteriaceae bacterium]
MGSGRRSIHIANTVIGHPITIDASPGKTWRGMMQGASGAGKSEILRTAICELSQLSYREQIVFDDKYVSFVELSDRIHIFDQQHAYNDVLASCVGEMRRRLYELKRLGKKELTPHDGEEYYQLDVWIDEANSFFAPEDPAITKTMLSERLRMACQLGQLGRAVGISLFVAGQNLSAKVIDTSLRNLLVDIRLGLRTGSIEATKFLVGDRSESAPCELLPDVPGIMYAMTNDSSTGNHFIKCRGIRTPLDVAEQIARETAHYKRELTFLNPSSEDYAF